MDNIKYCVYDESSENSSNFYETYDEALNDLNNDISYIWSFDAKIIDCNVG